MIRIYFVIIAVLFPHIHCSYQDVLEDFLGRGSGLNHDVAAYFHGFVFEQHNFRDFDGVFVVHPQTNSTVQKVSREICDQIKLSLTCPGSPFQHYPLNNCSNTIYGNVSGYLFASTKIEFPRVDLGPLGIFEDVGQFQKTLWNITRTCDALLTVTPTYLNGALHVTYTRNAQKIPRTDNDNWKKIKEQVQKLTTLGYPYFASGKNSDEDSKADNAKANDKENKLVGVAEGFVLRGGKYREWTEDMKNTTSPSYSRSIKATKEGIANALNCSKSRLQGMGLQLCGTPLFGSVNGWVYSTCTFTVDATEEKYKNLLHLQWLIDRTVQDCSTERDANYSSVQNFVTFESLELKHHTETVTRSKSAASEGTTTRSPR